MIKNLSKKRFIIFLSVALFLVLVIFIQYVVLSVLKNQERGLNAQLDTITDQIEGIPTDVTDEDKKDHSRWENGYIYDDEQDSIMIEN